jgi:hypothetical protein
MLKRSRLYPLENSFEVKNISDGVSIATTTWNEGENIEKQVPSIRMRFKASYTR